MYSVLPHGYSACSDGWRSGSIGRQGACSHHGGVSYHGVQWDILALIAASTVTALVSKGIGKYGYRQFFGYGFGIVALLVTVSTALFITLKANRDDKERTSWVSQSDHHQQVAEELKAIAERAIAERKGVPNTRTDADIKAAKRIENLQYYDRILKPGIYASGAGKDMDWEALCKNKDGWLKFSCQIIARIPVGTELNIESFTTDGEGNQIAVVNDPVFGKGYMNMWLTKLGQ